MLNIISQIIRRADGMDELQNVYPIANGVTLQTFDDSGVFFSPRVQSKKVSVSRAQNTL
ncbi:MAG: hypothetical protein OXG68_16350 [Chloroflexi bacterium]|nr:hypothetical protein [Chloroflexota bacterium]